MDIRDIEERFKKRLKEGIVKESIHKRATKIENLLKRGIQQGQYSELKDIGADLEDVAYILAYTENEAAFVKEVKRKGRQLKNYPTFGKRLEKARMKELFMKRSGKYEYYHKLPVEERMKEIRNLRKYPEWYLDRAILDLGSYFEAISSPNVKQAEERRQYKLIANLLYDFDLFKQPFNKAWNEDEQDFDEAKREEHARERVVKRAEAILDKVWKERIQGERERLQKSPSSHSIKR
jgi:hypothetical protein